MLIIHQLTAGYGGPPILKNVSLEVKEGEIVTLIGPNGAGKSTVLRSLFGLTTIAKESSLTFFGEELKGKPTESIIRRGIGYVPQGRTLFPSMTVEENLDMGAYLRKDLQGKRDAIEFVYHQFPKLKALKHRRAKLLSGGEQQMVAIGRALMLNPSLLLVDEPSLGLAPKIIHEVFQKLKTIRDHGTSILMVEQNAHQALAISTRGIVLELGEKRLEGPGPELLNNPEVGALYLGKSA